MLAAFCTRACRVLPVLGLAVLCAIPAMADVTLGGNARAVAMGGAGLASGDSPEAAALNPATLADTGLRFGIQWPSINARMTGASYSDVFKLLGSPSLDPQDALDYAISLGGHPTRMDASASTGLLLPQLDLRASAAIRTEVLPNAAFQDWANAGGTSVPSGELRADVYAAGLATLPSVGMGFHLPVDEETVGRVSVGVRVKPTRAYYSHYIIDADAINDGAPRLGDEMSGDNYLRRDSWSADLGLSFIPAAYPDVRLAMVVNNLIEPKAIDFGTATADGYFSRQIAPRSISAGAAIVKDAATLAADLVDITGAYGKMQLRLGTELRLPMGVALRGGYNTASGFTAGVGLGSFGIAYSQSTPVMLSETVRF